MAGPRLKAAITWPKYEKAVLAVFTEALRRLARRSNLPQGEEPINFELYWLCRKVHYEQMQAKSTIPFFIDFDSTNQPEPDDVADSRRLKKRPDFACKLTNEQAPDEFSSQIVFSLECKRLGQAEPNWVLNENYSEYGMLRFMQADHSYAKGCSSAIMIGYVQNMEPDDVLTDVNRHAGTRNIPSLFRAAASWAAKDVTYLSNRLARDFTAEPLDMSHLWVDLRHCTFSKPAPTPKPAASKNKNPTRKKTVKKRS